MIQKSKTYVYGSTAEKLAYDVYQENTVLKHKKKQKTNFKSKFKAIVLVLLIFSACLTITYRYALITELNYNYSTMEARYNKLRNENSSLQVAIEKETDLTKIKQIAEEKLNMHSPDKFQIVYMRVPRTDVTIIADEYEGFGEINTHNTFFAALIDKVDKFIKILY